MHINFYELNFKCFLRQCKNTLSSLCILVYKKSVNMLRMHCAWDTDLQYLASYDKMKGRATRINSCFESHSMSHHATCSTWHPNCDWLIPPPLSPQRRYPLLYYYYGLVLTPSSVLRHAKRLINYSDRVYLNKFTNPCFLAVYNWHYSHFC